MPLRRVKTKYLYVALIILFTGALVMALVSIQNNSKEDQERADKIATELALKFCHSVSDSNQRGKDVLLVFNIPTPVTPDMTQAQKESVKQLNKRRKAYAVIADTLYVSPKCTDGYEAKSNTEEAKRILQEAENAPDNTGPGG